MYYSLPGDLVFADFLFIMRPFGVFLHNKKIIYELPFWSPEDTQNDCTIWPLSSRNVQFRWEGKRLAQ